MMDERLTGIIDTAIRRESEAYDFYMGLMERTRNPGTRHTLSFIAGEEQKHREFLQAYRDGKHGDQPLRMTDVVYYKIAEHIEEPKIGDSMDSEAIYLVAAHREKRSHAFYTELAGLHGDGETRELLLRIANEELKHKEKMEYLYANTAFPQTDGG